MWTLDEELVIVLFPGQTSCLVCMQFTWWIHFRDVPPTPKKLAFRQKWVAKYFHAESYIEAYKRMTLFLPKIDQHLHITGVTDAPNRVLPPLQPTPERGRQKINRATTTKRKRSRAGMKYTHIYLRAPPSAILRTHIQYIV